MDSLEARGMGIVARAFSALFVRDLPGYYPRVRWFGLASLAVSALSFLTIFHRPTFELVGPIPFFAAGIPCLLVGLAAGGACRVALDAAQTR